jgi:hypothetical protein
MGQGRAGQGRAGQGRAGQGRAGQLTQPLPRTAPLPLFILPEAPQDFPGLCPTLRPYAPPHPGLTYAEARPKPKGHLPTLLLPLGGQHAGRVEAGGVQVPCSISPARVGPGGGVEGDIDGGARLHLVACEGGGGLVGGQEVGEGWLRHCKQLGCKNRCGGVEVGEALARQRGGNSCWLQAGHRPGGTGVW